MRIIQKLVQHLGFTASERKVILLLIAAFLVGWGIRAYRGAIGKRPEFDYSRIDSEFIAFTTRTADTLDTPANKGTTYTFTGAAKGGAKQSPRGLVNINTASKNELIGLPGIGEVMAGRIISYRNEHGPFNSVAGLAAVKGIGLKKLEKLIPHCTIGK